MANYIPDMKSLAKELETSGEVTAFAPPAVRKAQQSQQVTLVEQVKHFADIPVKKLDQMENDLLNLVKDWQELAQSIRNNLKRDTDQLEALGDRIKERAQLGVNKLRELDQIEGWDEPSKQEGK